MVFKASSKKGLYHFEIFPLFMGEDTPDLPVYQWDSCFYLPVQWGLTAMERAVVEHKGHPFLMGGKRHRKSRGNWCGICLKDFSLGQLT